MSEYGRAPRYAPLRGSRHLESSGTNPAATARALSEHDSPLLRGINRSRDYTTPEPDPPRPWPDPRVRA